MNGICFGGCVTLGAVLFSLLVGGSTTCPKQCHCLSTQRWKCFNVTLGDLGGFTSRLRSLTIANLSHASSDSTARSFLSVRQLEIRDSRIGEITETFVSSFPNVKLVRFRKSTLDCSEKLLPLRKWEHVVAESVEKLVCSTLDGLSNLPLFSALREIEWRIAQCPARCKCSVYSNYLGYKEYPNMLINCSNANLRTLPLILPQSWPVYLDLSHNELTQVSEAFSSSAYKNVMILNLAHNFITSINVSSSGTANHFDILDFSFNRLTEVPDILLDKQTLVDSHVMLRGNPWTCDCGNIEKFMIQDAQELNVVSDYDYITCEDGQHLKGLLSSKCMTSSDAWSVPYLCLIQTLAIILFSYYTNKVIRLCQSMYNRGILHIGVHFLLRKASS